MIDVVELVGRRGVHRRRADDEAAYRCAVDTQRIRRIGRLRVAPGKERDRPATRLQELARDLLREALVAVADRAAADSADSPDERQRNEDEADDAGADEDPRPVARAQLGARSAGAHAAPVAAGRAAVEQAAAPGVRPVKSGA